MAKKQSDVPPAGVWDSASAIPHGESTLRALLGLSNEHTIEAVCDAAVAEIKKLRAKDE